MSQTEEYDVMVAEVQELGSDGLNLTVYDTRPDEDATFLTGMDAPEATEDDPEWKQQVADDLDGSALMKYVDHEWRSATAEYSEAGVIKEGSKMNREYGRFVVQEPSTLKARIERVSDGFIVTVEADGATQFELTLTDADLSLETHPALRE